MLKTSYFARAAKEPGAVSNARFTPKWYTGAPCLPLAPRAEMLKITGSDEYRLGYHDEILSVPGPDLVLWDMACTGQTMTSSFSASSKSGHTATMYW